jgi:Zn-dependent peptidase ImmA (M78 family)
MQKTIRVKLNNPKILTWAREELELSIQEVADRFNKAPTTIEAWENGVEAPTFLQLTELANYYKRPVPILFLKSIPPKSPKPHDYRTLPYITTGKFMKETLLAYREVYNMLSETRELLEELEINITFSLPTWTLEDEPEKKAMELRDFLGISIEKQIETFNNYYVAQDIWRDILFDHGVIVRICQMPISDARAFCLLRNNLAGIGLSNEDREHGRIFSLFHEVCHLSLLRPGVSGIASNTKSLNQEIEQYCDKFSASFLLPRAHPEVQKSLELFQGSVDFLELSQHIATKFKVSKYVVIRRALDLDYIQPEIYWQTIAEWKIIDAQYAKKKKEEGEAGGNYNSTQISYIGKRFVSLVMEALQRNYITSVEVKRKLGIDPTAVEINI